MIVEDQIIEALKPGDLSIEELCTKLSSVKPVEVKAAVLPLINSERVALTKDRRLSLRGNR